VVGLVRGISEELLRDIEKSETMNQLSIEIPDNCLSSNDKLSQAVLTAAALQLYQAGNLSSQRAARLSKLSHSQFLKQAGESCDEPGTPPEQAERLKGSRYLARVLWALSEGEKSGLTPMSAADIAKFITAHSNFHTQETNTARFFRDCRRKERYEEYWVTEEEGSRRSYQISDLGRKLLTESQIE